MNTLMIAMLMSTLFAGELAGAAEEAHWGYEGPSAPENWGSLSFEFAACASGKNQSPIDLTAAVDAALPGLEFHYEDAPLDVVNNGHTVQYSYGRHGGLAIDGVTYDLVQFHFHAPSENLIEGDSFPLEVHLVHADAAGNLAVVAVMFDEGRPNPFIDLLWKEMPDASSGAFSTSDVMINAGNLLPKGRHYYRYSGSLTTPPCSEGVKWIVLREPLQVSKVQVEQFLAAVGQQHNNRPVQPLNARLVLKE